MKKKVSFKQILAILCIVLLLGMYLSTLVFALIRSPWAQTMLKISLLGTFGIPIVIYVIFMFYKLTRKSSNPEDNVYNNGTKDSYTEENFKDSDE